jgi:alpha-L-rhamnosidase
VKQGFTTLAETWELSPVFKDASVDHVFLGDVAAWYVNDLAGINFDPETGEIFDETLEEEWETENE